MEPEESTNSAPVSAPKNKAPSRPGRRGPKQRQDNRIAASSNELALKIKQVGCSTIRLAHVIRVSTRGAGFVSQRVWTYIASQRPALIANQNEFDATKLWRLTLSMLHVKSYLASKKISSCCENPDTSGFEQLVVPTPAVIESISRINRFPLPLAVMVNALGHVKCGEVDWFPLIAGTMQGNNYSCDPFTLSYMDLRTILSRYSHLGAADRDIFRQNCPIPGIEYSVDNTEITNLDRIAPEEYEEDIADIVDQYLSFARLIDSKIPGLLVPLSISSNGDGGASILGNVLDVNATSLPNYPGNVRLKSLEHMADPDFYISVLSLFGERSRLGQDPFNAYRDAVFGKQMATIRWLTAFETFLGK